MHLDGTNTNTVGLTVEMGYKLHVTKSIRPNMYQTTLRNENRHVQILLEMASKGILTNERSQT